MNWLIIVLSGHLLNALAFLMDKFLLTKKVTSPFVYAFFIGIFGVVGMALIPFGFAVPAWPVIARALLGGGTFILALIFFFAALKKNEASRVVPLSGGLVPAFTIVFAYFLLGERLQTEQLIAFVALVLGGILITVESGKKRSSSKIGYFYALVSAIIFAGSSVLMKIVFNEQAFISGFVWSRIGGFLFALLILLIPSQRYQAFHQPKEKRAGKTALLFFTGQAAGALGYIILAYGISLASVSLVNAMQGVQYAFLLILVVFLSRRFPKVLSEKLSGGVLVQKIAAIILISLGIGLIAF